MARQVKKRNGGDIIERNINIIRKNILMRGYANINNIRQFIPCGYVKAKKIFTLEKNKSLEFKRTNNNVIDVKRLLPYIYLTEEEVYNFAKMEEDGSFVKTKVKYFCFPFGISDEEKQIVREFKQKYSIIKLKHLKNTKRGEKRIKVIYADKPDNQIYTK